LVASARASSLFCCRASLTASSSGDASDSTDPSLHTAARGVVAAVACCC
jgi:hypothetical protein